MKWDRQWRGWRFLERGALWTTLALCTFVAAQPLRERVIAWRSQRALEAKWQRAVEQKRARLKNASSRSGAGASKRRSHRGKAKNDLAVLWPLVRLTCAKMNLDAVVVEGTSAAQLKQGPGHELNTSLPGGPNCVIAAHRNAFGWWFYRLNKLHPGDFVELATPGRKFIYTVKISRTVSVRDTSILHHHAKASPRLTLYSCTLPKTDRRLVVVADLLGTEDT